MLGGPFVSEALTKKKHVEDEALSSKDQLVASTCPQCHQVPGQPCSLMKERLLFSQSPCRWFWGWSVTPPPILRITSLMKMGWHFPTLPLY